MESVEEVKGGETPPAAGVLMGKNKSRWDAVSDPGLRTTQSTVVSCDGLLEGPHIHCYGQVYYEAR